MPSWIRIQIANPDTDTDPGAPIESGYGSTTLYSLCLNVSKCWCCQEPDEPEEEEENAEEDENSRLSAASSAAAATSAKKKKKEEKASRSAVTSH
jgi:hypothetical protein